MTKNSFNEVLESIILRAGGSVDKIDFEKFTESLNHSLIFTPSNHWLGVNIQKNPLDLMILQEIIFDKRPDNIIECGTAYGGSAYFMATMMDLMNINGTIITIENEIYPTPARAKRDLMKIDEEIVSVDYDVYQSPIHPKIRYIHSDCLSSDLPKLKGKTMLILDCDHSADHVFKELAKFSDLVTLNQYIIVEDTDAPDKKNGPSDSVDRFLKKNKNFIVDKSREKFGLSSNPGGYLLKVS
jgi:cephalosporin hydroxylase